MKIFTIGFTKKSAETFFTILQHAGVKRIVDIRLNNTSQLAGFAKVRDLPFFLSTIGNISYIHHPEFAPTPDIFENYKKKKGSWEAYEEAYDKLLEKRKTDSFTSALLRDKDCFLCSESDPDYCHRRLLAERIQRHQENLEVVHL
ncbi:MAG: DUF488 domain-containing protein [Candidatus Hydrogenedentes bacterium]|nr:DUF488 domain-containing protein [Candidatus Hydrogenedentota bacterium]